MASAALRRPKKKIASHSFALAAEFAAALQSSEFWNSFPNGQINSKLLYMY